MSWLDDYKKECGELPPVEDDVPEEVTIDDLFESLRPSDNQIHKMIQKNAHVKVDMFLAINKYLIEVGIEDKDERLRIIEIIF